MRTWFLMTVAGISIIAGVSSEGKALWGIKNPFKSVTKSVSCYSGCSQSFVDGFWKNPDSIETQGENFKTCLQCPSYLDSFTARVKKHIRNGDDPEKTSFVCETVEGLIRTGKRYPYAQKISKSCPQAAPSYDHADQPVGAYAAHPALGDAYSGESEDGSPDKASFMPNDDIEQ